MYPDFQKRKITKIEHCYSDVGNLLFGNREIALQGDPKNNSLMFGLMHILCLYSTL
jgi:hypothetical protein